jgi:hypothetical protein
VKDGNRLARENDPLWMKDVLLHSNMLPEPSRVNFARLLLSRCETGEIWLMRILYNMLNQALRA